MSAKLVLLQIEITATPVGDNGDLKIDVKSKILPPNILPDEAYSVLSRIKKFAYTEVELHQKPSKS